MRKFSFQVYFLTFQLKINITQAELLYILNQYYFLKEARLIKDVWWYYAKHNNKNNKRKKRSKDFYP